ncbi:thiamine pyrophosphate-binding protein [Mycobacterium vicinigordonae]|uniref:Thiamine pyrophosphate-binding protein n=1 Tax=Mycobacterium vicinigordonae TaxID=1719132 RepID=A0A7D6I818_9MYCO|nr:thiamine pyrophosphate-binding protein [Mycobacterium vicinigordonae]QLL08076.1 thiamine pyrophosphate-binding protein [Mycobacterium vicinigordonae]
MHNRHLFSNALGRQRFADELVDYLIALGVEYIFGMPAESVNSLVHAASQRSEIRVVTTRHETAAALMAVGYAKASGRLGVCFGTAGPGATNLVAGAYEAYLGRVPLLAISGQVPVASIGREAFQEIDSEALFKPCTSSSVQIQATSQFERLARSAVLALHESTACHVAIPGDVLYAPIAAAHTGWNVPKLPEPGLPSKEEFSSVAEFLESGDLAIMLSCADGAQAQLAEALSRRLCCSLTDVRVPGVLSAGDVLVVGRVSPLLKQRVAGHANLFELTDRRFAGGRLPYIRQVVCDVEATLHKILDSQPEPEKVVTDTVFTDLDDVDGIYSMAGIPGAALPLALGAALAGNARSTVVTDGAQLGQFVAELSTLVSTNADVQIRCLKGTEKFSSTKQLESAFGLQHGIIAVPRQTPSTRRDPRPGERSLAQHLENNLAAPVQISEFCASRLPGLSTAQRSANAQAPSMSAAALRKAGCPSAGTLVATGAALLLQLNGIYDAALDHAPILVVTVEAPDWQLDAGRLLDEVCSASYVVDDPATAAATVRQACAATTAPSSGVVHLRVRGEALNSQWPDSQCAATQFVYMRTPAPDESAITEAIAALRDAERVAIVAGRGAAGCSELLTSLSAVLDCKVHLTMGGDSVIDDPGLRAYGRVGGSGDLRAYHALAKADVLLLVGVSNRGSAFDLGAAGRSIVVNTDPNALLRLRDRDVAVLGDAMATLEAMVDRLRPSPGPEKTSQSPRRCRRSRWAERAPLRASRLTQAINEELARFDGTSTVCADVGVNTLWVYRYITSMTRSIWSASFGTMGFAVPAAITAAKNTDTQLAVAVAGDGGTSVTLNQIQSSTGVAKPVVFVVVNNLALAAIKFESEIMGWPDRGSAVPDIEFAQYATSVGIESRRVDTLCDFRAAFREAISAPRPYLIDARCVLNDAPVQAGKKHWRQVIGFFVAWSKEGRPGARTFGEVTRAVIRGKLYEKGLPG